MLTTYEELDDATITIEDKHGDLLISMEDRDNCVLFVVPDPSVAVAIAERLLAWARAKG